MEGVDRISNLKQTFRSLKWYEVAMMAVMMAFVGLRNWWRLSGRTQKEVKMMEDFV